MERMYAGMRTSSMFNDEMKNRQNYGKAKLVNSRRAVGQIS